MPKLSDFRITKTAVDDLPADKDTIYFDSRLTGFGIRTKPNGKKTYLIQYRNSAGGVRRFSIGQHGPVTAEKAREEAKKLLGRVAAGEDPSGERKDLARAETVAELCDAYIAAVELGLKDPRKAVIRGKGGRPKKASTLREDKSRIERHIKPLLGGRRVRDLKTKDITKFIHDVTVGKTAADIKTKKQGRARVSGGAGIASRTAGLLGGIFQYAVTQGIVDANPCRGVSRPPDGKRNVRLTADQYKALGDALRLAEAEFEPWQAVDAIWALALTGCRKNEIACLQPSEVDVAGQALRLIDSKENESVRPLGAAALRVIRPRIGNAKFVFYSDRNLEAPYGGLPAAWTRIMKRIDPSVPMPKLTLHGLRHAFASSAGDLKYSDPTIAALIGHSHKGSVTSGYVHHLDEALISAADKVAAYVAQMMSGHPSKN